MSIKIGYILPEVDGKVISIWIMYLKVYLKYYSKLYIYKSWLCSNSAQSKCIIYIWMVYKVVNFTCSLKKKGTKMCTIFS